jgi:hypothetical protein
MQGLECLTELREQGRMTWIEPEHGWVVEPEAVLTALARAGFEEHNAKSPGANVIAPRPVECGKASTRGRARWPPRSGSIGPSWRVRSCSSTSTVSFSGVCRCDVDDWWADLDGEILRCLREGGPSTPAEVGRRLGVSESAATSLLCVLAGAGKVRISLVEPNDGAGEPPLRRLSARCACRWRARGSAPERPRTACGRPASLVRARRELRHGRRAGAGRGPYTADQPVHVVDLPRSPSPGYECWLKRATVSREDDVLGEGRAEPGAIGRRGRG